MSPGTSFSARTFRVVPPKWAHDPLSGEGARRHGGRFNPPGQSAFYSALDPHTAYAEYTQNLFDRPGLFCAFDVSSARVLDLRLPDTLAALQLHEDDLGARWFGLSDTPTQLLASRLVEQGFDGLLYASLQHQNGINLVLWRWNQGRAGVRITLVDRLGEAVTKPLQD